MRTKKLNLKKILQRFGDKNKEFEDKKGKQKMILLKLWNGENSVGSLNVDKECKIVVQELQRGDIEGPFRYILIQQIEKKLTNFFNEKGNIVSRTNFDDLTASFPSSQLEEVATIWENEKKIFEKNFFQVFGFNFNELSTKIRQLADK